MKRNLSIKWRLALQFSGLVLLILFLSASISFLLFDTRAQKDIDTLLFAQLENIRNDLKDETSTERLEDLNGLIATTIEEMKSIGLFTVVTNAKGTMILRSSQKSIPLPATDGYSTVRNGDQAYRILRGQAGSFTIAVGQDLSSYTNLREHLFSVLLNVFGSMLVLSFGLSALFAGRALHPLVLLNRKVKGMHPEKLPESSLASGYPGDEIGELALTFDDFLQRLSAAFRREKQFTQDASHELRTPLMVMKSSLELIALRNENLNPAQRERLSLMQDAILRMERLIEEMLFLSRGMKEQEKEPIALSPFLREFTQTYAALAEAKKLSFRLAILSEVTVHTSPVSLEKVFGNLLKNAVHFTEHGSITVHVEGRSVSIEDTGGGIAKEDLPHIFERLYRADSARVHVHGFGLGLAICKEICDREGWQIEVTSTVGKGSRFTVRF
ncbi:MAG: HAMP domain-containing sensor histidine kinase [Candidatus Peribacteraceae bacterium]|nr:HAMP domain-containing sensor histidine kinase [Candidatus Peribacteraceae bacterium]